MDASGSYINLLDDSVEIKKFKKEVILVEEEELSSD